MDSNEQPEKVELVAQIVTKMGRPINVEMSEDSLEGAYNEACICMREGGIFSWPQRGDRPHLIVSSSDVSSISIYTAEGFKKLQREARAMQAAQQAGIVVPGNGIQQ